MTVAIHRLYWLTIVVLSSVALSGCGARDSGTVEVAPVSSFAGAETGDAVSIIDDPATGGSGVGRATYEGDASGSYAVGEQELAGRSFGAHVRLTADFRDNYIWGVISDGKDTLTLEPVFDRLTLEPAALGTDATAGFENRLTGALNHKRFTGEWTGRFLGSGASRSSVAGTFRAETDDLGEGLSGSFNAPYRAHATRTLQDLNDLSEKLKGRLAWGMAGTAWSDAVSSTDAPGGRISGAGSVSWNTGLTQSPQDFSSGDGVQVHQAINARYEGDALVFDRVTLSAQPAERLVTSTEPEAPGYRQALSPVVGSPRWKGVEYLSVDALRRWNYSILFSDIEDADDTDYLAGGFSIWMPDLEDPADTRIPMFAASASGSDPFQVGNVEGLEGDAVYEGDAAGIYVSKITAPALRYFNADVRLTADFDRDSIRGVVTEGRDTASNELIFQELGLRPAALGTEGAAFFKSWASGVVDGRPFTGHWGGQFFGNGDAVTDVPGSVAGTFGVRPQDYTESIVGYFGAYDRELMRLPSGHGLDAGKIIVQPGEPDERGDVAVSCPEGGLACIVTVGADGDAFYDRDGGVPAFGPVHGSHWRDNPGAEDLLDHWNEPAARLREAMELSAVSDADSAARKTVLTGLFDSAGGDSAATGTRLRNVSPDDIEIIGERNGITYGRWKGGPAGTLNIEFDWRFAKDLGEATQARMERAGKSWSWRLMDDFGIHTVERGTEVRFDANPPRRPSAFLGEFEEDVVTNGLLIAVVTGSSDSTTSWGGGLRADRTDDDFTPWLGNIMLAPAAADSTFVMAHEIGHVLGIVAGNAPSVARYINDEDATFAGPEAQRANGEAPVPLQWWDDDYSPVTPGTPGGEVDEGHLGVCASIMAYCSDASVTYLPSELDFAFLDDIGYELLDAKTAAEPELYGYGAWGRYSAWGAGVERTIEYEGGRIVDARDTLRASADAFGTVPGAALGQGDTPLQGNVTWSGSLIGVDLGQAMLPPVFGNAELSVELSSLEGTALFDDLTVYVDGASGDFRKSSMEYAIDVAGNAFSDENGHVRGGFFGPAHEEMAGVLDDRTPEVNLLAGFGGKR